MDKKQIAEAIKYLAEAGVYFSIYHAEGGQGEISVENVIKYVADPQKYWANVYGVSVETFQQYEHYLNEYRQCTAKTAKGKRCLRTGNDVAIQNFKYGETTLCAYHQKHALKTLNFS